MSDLASMDVEQLKELGRTYRKETARWHNKQMALKVNLNSAYGVQINPYFRYYNFDNADAITAGGRLAIQWIEKALNGYVNRIVGTADVDYVIASDTDSIYLQLGALVDKVYAGKNPTKDEIIDFLDEAMEKGIQPFIDRSYQEMADYTNSFEQKMRMKRESIFDKGFWKRKKHYAINIWDKEGVRFKEPKTEVKGITVVRSSTPSAVRNSLREIFKVMLNKTEEDLQVEVKRFMDEYRSYPLEEIARNSGISNMRKYSDRQTIYRKGTPEQVKAALIHNWYLDQLGVEHVARIYDGDKVKYVHLTTPNPTKQKVVAFVDQLPKELAHLREYVDYERLFHATFMKPLQEILNIVGWSAERVSSLDDCFV